MMVLGEDSCVPIVENVGEEQILAIYKRIANMKSAKFSFWVQFHEHMVS